MSKVLHSRVFRFLVCFLLIGCILINLSPLKVEATSVVVPTVAKLSFEALMAILYSMGIGIVATELTVEAWNKVGNSLTEAITDTGDATITEAWIDLEAMYDSYIPGGGMDPDDELKWTEKLKTVLSRGLLGAIAGWLCTLVNMGGYEVEGDSTTGWTYYGNYYYPTFPEIDGFPYMYLANSAGTLTLFYTSDPIYYYKMFDAFYQVDRNSGYYKILVGDYDFSNWDSSSSYTVSNLLVNSSGGLFAYAPVWCNVDIISTKTNPTYVYMTGSEPSTTQTEIIEPSIYVGDIPQQIQDGEKDKDNLNLPLLDPWKLFQSPDSAFDDITQLQQQLKDGTMTLDQYLEQVQVQDSTDSGDSGSTTPSDPSTDPSDPTVPVDGPVQDIKPYGLDLKDYFPFCIPFDIYEFFSVLIAEPTAPQFHWELQDLSGRTYSIDVDLSPWDSFAAVFRRMQLLLFIVGLAAASRKFIKW